VRGHVEGAAAADAEVDARRLDQRLDGWLDQARLWRRRSNGEIFGQAFALRQVEDGESLQERDGVRLLAGLPCPPLLVFGNEAVGIDDGGAVLALADIATERVFNPSRKPVRTLPLGALRGVPAEGVGRDGWLGRRGRLSPP
jgi:hypothetical protein